jgi:hypothetical protein
VRPPHQAVRQPLHTVRACRPDHRARMPCGSRPRAAHERPSSHPSHMAVARTCVEQWRHRGPTPTGRSRTTSLSRRAYCCARRWNATDQARYAGILSHLPLSPLCSTVVRTGEPMVNEPRSPPLPSARRSGGAAASAAGGGRGGGRRGGQLCDKAAAVGQHPGTQGEAHLPNLPQGVGARRAQMEKVRPRHCPRWRPACRGVS